MDLDLESGLGLLDVWLHKLLYAAKTKARSHKDAMTSSRLDGT